MVYAVGQLQAKVDQSRQDSMSIVSTCKRTIGDIAYLAMLTWRGSRGSVFAGIRRLDGWVRIRSCGFEVDRPSSS